MLVRRILMAAALFAWGVGARAQSLDARINGLFGSPMVKGALVSLDVVEITNKGTVPVFGHDATTPLGPASNCKLLTTAAAFERYGPKATFKTNLYKVGDDLVLIGGGDPGFGDAKLAEAANESPVAPFEQFADRLKQLGITRYRNLVVDDRVFDTQWVNPDWKTDQLLKEYSAPIGGLNFNANCLDWTPKLTAKGVAIEMMPDTSYITVTNKATKGATTAVSLVRPAKSNKFELRGTVAASGTVPYSTPIYDPGMWTGTILRDVLERAGIDCAGTVRRADNDEQYAGGTLIASHETPILAVIKRANTNSLNMMAECLCKRLGYDATGKPGSWASGTAAVGAFVQSIGGQAEWITLDDGSGLSNKNRVAARAFTTVLAHVAGRPDGNLFIETLAEAGEDGTLEKRFAKMTVAPHVHAKTGHIDGVSTLSGFIDIENAGGGGGGLQRRFAFSILCNKYPMNVNTWQDQVCQAIYEWAGGK